MRLYSQNYLDTIRVIKARLEHETDPDRRKYLESCIESLTEMLPKDGEFDGIDTGFNPNLFG
jgi:hypothetical protein